MQSNIVMKTIFILSKSYMNISYETKLLCMYNVDDFTNRYDIYRLRYILNKGECYMLN